MSASFTQTDLAHPTAALARFAAGFDGESLPMAAR